MSSCISYKRKDGWEFLLCGQWGEGDLNFMLNLFKKCHRKTERELLWWGARRTVCQWIRPRSEKKDLYDTKVEGFRDCRIPYLNGGLFERDRLMNSPSDSQQNTLIAYSQCSQYNYYWWEWPIRCWSRCWPKCLGEYLKTCWKIIKTKVHSILQKKSYSICAEKVL